MAYASKKHGKEFPKSQTPYRIQVLIHDTKHSQDNQMHSAVFMSQNR